MKKQIICSVIFAIVMVIAVSFRLPQLSQRPMHTDEAVHAYIFTDLLEQGQYKYDPYEYHGPTLNFLTLIPAWLSSAENLGQTTEVTLRIVPVFFGLLLIFLFLFVTDAISPPIVIIAATLTAISPAMVFYSRYYIQEMLLICFTFGVIVFAYRYIRTKKIIHAIFAGLFLGLMHATKETCIIAIASMSLAMLLTILMSYKKGHFLETFKAVKLTHIIISLATAVVVSGLFYSSFLTNPQGIVDSVRTYTTYFNRAGSNPWHIHPWYYYLKTLVYFGSSPDPPWIWSEAVIIILAIVGFIAAVSKKGVKNNDHNFIRFIAFYALVMTIAYSVIPYKTPWCLLGFFHPMIILAATGAVTIITIPKKIWLRIIPVLIITAATAHLGYQSYLANYKYSADPCNPYVYAHSTGDVITIAQKIEAITDIQPNGRDIYIFVICPENDSWPFPWYLRNFKNVGFYNTVNKNVSAVPIIITFPIMVPELKKHINFDTAKENAYVPLFNLYKELRPYVQLICFIRKDLKDAYEQHQVQLILSQSKNKK